MEWLPGCCYVVAKVFLVVFWALLCSCYGLLPKYCYADARMFCVVARVAGVLLCCC